MNVYCSFTCSVLAFYGSGKWKQGPAKSRVLRSFWTCLRHPLEKRQCLQTGRKESFLQVTDVGQKLPSGKVPGRCWGDHHPVHWLVDQDTAEISARRPTVTIQPVKHREHCVCIFAMEQSVFLFFVFFTVCWTRARLPSVSCPPPGFRGQDLEVYAKPEGPQNWCFFCWRP